MIELFEEKADELLAQMSAKQALAAALACITGHTKPPRRTSLMSGVPDYVTVQFTSINLIRAKGYVWNALNRDFAEDIANNIKQLTLTEDSMGACFDLPIAGLDVLNELIESGNCPYSTPKTLPKLQQSAYMSKPGYGSGRGGGRGFGRGGGGRGGRGGSFGRGSGGRGGNRRY